MKFIKSDKRISSEVITLAIPIIFSNLSRVIMGLTDMAMVSRLGAIALAATGMGSLLLWVIMSMGIGLRTAVQTVTSRRLGQKLFSECGHALHNGIILAIILAIPATLLGTYYSIEIAELFLEDSDVIPQCANYIHIGIYGVLFVLISFAFQGFYTGIEQTKIHMKVTIISNIINVYLNAGLIYGTEGVTAFFEKIGLPWIAVLWQWYDFPVMAVKGAALATVIASGWMIIQYSFYILNEKIKIYKPVRFQYSAKNIIQQIKLGFPIGAQEVISMIGFAIFYKIIGTIGTIELATSEVILNIAHASFMPAVGVGMAAATLVGKYLGEENPENAELAIWSALKWALLIMGSMGLLFIFGPQWVIPIFSDDPEIIRLGIPCLQIIGVLQFFDAIGLTLFFVLTGAGNTRFPAIINMTTCWFLFLPLSYYLSIYLKMGIIGAWLGFAAWIIPFAVIMALKVSTGSWKKIEV
ncbi:MAG: MATE family efflux transporter [Candidatus Marinimicrobia bacterium]|nr:MATE family efflux transporter [Candidatus Neomarinimicrobiota bacterium]